MEFDLMFLFFQAVFMVEEGCSPEQVDNVVENFGIPIGPFKVADLSGK